VKKINEKHLEFIQSAIARMNQNSINIKTCCVTILTAFSGLAKAALIRDAILVVSVLLFIFCIMDSYYLYLERGFRHLYEAASNLKDDIKLKGDFDMTISEEDRKPKKFFKALFSLTEIGFYAGIFIALWIVLVLL
jgi:hypothetical protein